MRYLKLHKLSLKCKKINNIRKSLKSKPQVGLRCGQFLQITPFKMSITCPFLYQIKNFFHLWISKEKNYKKKLSIKKNRTMYKELKPKKMN